ncbi:uncharacterized protein [Ptychodera flava]|uniref:uncharacterized protein isoform X2 n=1 Tax=Ptychodera flava TaxID=63121 RepID=UPI003969C220
MPRAFLVKKKKQRVESIVEELAKQGLEAKLSSSDGESDKKSDDDSSDKTSLLIAEVFSLGERKRQAEATEDAGESKLRTLEDLIERRLRETLEDTECRSKRDSQGESESVSQNRRLLNFSVNGDSQRERRDHETIFPKEKSKPPPLLRASPRSAFERVVSPKYVTVSPQTLAQVGPPPPLESRGFQSEFYYRSDVPTIPRTLPQSSAYGLTISSPRYILTDPRKQPYCEPDGALNLSRRPSKSDSDVDDGSHEDDGRDRDSPSRGAEYITKKKYILERNGRPEVMPAIELINGSGPTHRSPRRLPHHANEISPLFSSHSKTPFPYSSIFAERPRPESFLYSKSHSPIERNGYGPFEGQPETFVGRPSYPIQEAPLNLHQSPKDQKTFLGDPAEAERQRGRLDYPSDINSNELGLPNVYSGAQADNNDIKVTVTCDEPGKLHPSKIKINDLTLEQVISVQNTMPMKRNGKTIARQPILGVEYIQNGTDLKLRDMMDKEGNKSLGSEDSNDTDLGDEKDSLSEGSVGVGEGEEGAFVNGPTMEGRSDDEKPSPNRKYVCDICGKGFSRSNTLVTHKRIHTGDKPFKCEVCGRAFRQPGNLTRHRLTHTTVKPYVCSQCGKAFNRASNLHTHMRTHTNYKPFICQYCGKGFHQKIDMKIHSYTHTGEKPHKCKKCGRGFKQLTHLTYHMRTHSEVKMYTCSYCGKGFNQKGNLQAHIYGHTGERPYKCEICGKGFTLASTLNTHRRTHADKKPFVCKYCGKDFYQKNALKSHLVASHPYTGESLL